MDVSSYEEEITPTSAIAPYSPLPTSQDDNHHHSFDRTPIEEGPKHNVALSAADKWRLARPLLAKYMLPLCESRHICTPLYFSKIYSQRLSRKLFHQDIEIIFFDRVLTPSSNIQLIKFVVDLKLNCARTLII